MRHLCARVSLYPKFAGLDCLFHVPGDRLMEASRDEILLCLTGSVAQFVCLSGVVGSHAGFSNIHMYEAQPCVGECKIRVEFDGMLEKRNCCSISCCAVNFNTGAEGFKRF